jgi:CubicO group peptidase (beta-lactamase class C family)
MCPGIRRRQADRELDPTAIKETGMRRSLPDLLRRALLSVTAGVLAVPAAGLLAVPEPASAQAGCGPVTQQAAADLFDGELPDRLRADQVPGGVVSVVSGGATVFSTGYGVADIERGVAFNPATSLVRIASITKLFTWTAVMQQVEADRLDLGTDVNQYLSDFQIPATYPEPVTLRTLMNHTAGFEDRIIGTAARSAEDVPPLGEYLADNVPARIRPSGEVSAYSNFGAALAGHIVAEVSGEPYDQYVQRHILDRLGMSHSTAAEPVPAALAADLAASYDSDVAPPERVPFQFDKLAPDGSISATAEDIARFMAAHLDEEGGGGILAPDTMALMHQRSFSADPRLDGYAHGFKERTFNGHRALMHDGGWEGFVSGLVLVPDCDLGVFFSVNGTSAGEAVFETMEVFFDRFVPEQERPEVPEGSASDVSTAPADPAAGFYSPTRRNESTMERLLTLLGPRRLTIDGDGTVHFRGEEWTAAGDGVYHQVDGEEWLSFRAGTGGRRYVITDGPSFELLGAAETLPVNLVVLLVFLVAALSALAVPIAGAWRRVVRRQAPRRSLTGTWRLARSLAAGAALLGIVFLGLIMVTLLGDPGDFIYGAPTSFRLLLTVPLVVLVGAAAAVAGTVVGWRGAGASVVSRIHQVWLLAGLAVLVWFVWYWNLIGWWSV